MYAKTMKKRNLREIRSKKFERAVLISCANPHKPAGPHFYTIQGSAPSPPGPLWEYRGKTEVGSFRSFYRWPSVDIKRPGTHDGYSYECAAPGAPGVRRLFRTCQGFNNVGGEQNYHDGGHGGAQRSDRSVARLLKQDSSHIGGGANPHLREDIP